MGMAANELIAELASHIAGVTGALPGSDSAELIQRAKVFLAYHDPWQPIETAPRDGTKIDLWVSDNEGGFRVPNGFWSEEIPPFNMRDWPPNWMAENRWYDGCDGLAADPDCPDEVVTHWMPLPEPPEVVDWHSEAIHLGI